MELPSVRLCFVLVQLILSLDVVAGVELGPVINTTAGRMVGVRYSDPSGAVTITAYRGIPYAEPPVGPLRFAKPEPKAPWTGVFNAFQYGPICPQPGSENATQSEDCLNLNIFVPSGVNKLNTSGNSTSEEEEEGDPLAVMVWIHGGGFLWGAGSLYDGTILAAVGRVIVVNLNYRLGVLGFLSTADDAAKGNYGFWDQRLAIKWVRENIGYFNGDPFRITVFGESAGSISLAVLTMSPVMNNNLFQRAILESGSFFQAFALSSEVAASRSRHLGDELHCGSEGGSLALIECLRNASVNDIMKVEFQRDSFYELSPFYGTVDGEFIPVSLSELQAMGLMRQYDYIVGVNSDEGTLALSANALPYLLDSNEMSYTLSLIMQPFCKCSNYLQLSETLKFMYTQGMGTGDPKQNARAVFDIIGDCLFLAPAVATARGHAVDQDSLTTTYMYYFPYVSEFRPSPYPNYLVRGAGHSDEIEFVFGFFMVSNPGSLSAFLSYNMVNYWTNFAKIGDPNGDGLPEWPEFDAENETYIILEPAITTGQRLRADKVAFWNDFLPTNAELTDPNRCPVNVPSRNVTTVEKPGTKTVEILSKDGGMLGSVVGALRVADEAMGGQEIAEFLGIPYAKPPLGDLRFRPPRDTGPWGDEPLGIPENPPPACPQDVTQDPWMVRLGFNRTSEDCLTLNIYAPVEDTDSPLPVVVFVHPGFGTEGTSSTYDGILLASKLRAMVVIVNYRLGALGFMTTEDEEAPGNYGLHDVLASLKWVNTYIGSFGGNPDLVTVLGYGAGAELTHLLVLSEKAEGLFQRAVLMSSTAISSSVANQVQPDATEQAKTLAAALECPTDSSEVMIKCLREKPADDLVSHTSNPDFGRAFPIIVDKDIVADVPIDLMKAGKFNSVDLILGFTTDQNARESFQLLPGDTGDCPSVEDIEQLIRQVSKLSFHNADMASLTLATEYLAEGGLGDACQTRGSFRRFMQEYLTSWSILESARLHALAGDTVHLYAFDHEPREHYYSILPSLAGPSYGDDLQFLFGDPYSPISDDLGLSYTLKDRMVTLEMMAYLKNFTQIGRPGVSLSGAEWPAFDPATFPFLTLDACPDARSGLADGWDHILRFWTELMPSVTAPPPPGPDTTPTPEPCTVGEEIGFNLTPREASTLIEALMGVSIGFLVIAIFFLGGCVAYRNRALKSEKNTTWDTHNADKETFVGGLYKPSVSAEVNEMNIIDQGDDGSDRNDDSFD